MFDIGKELQKAFDEGCECGIKEFVKKLESSAILCEFDNGNGKHYFEEVVKFVDIERIKEEMTEKEGGKGC